MLSKSLRTITAPLSKSILKSFSQPPKRLIAGSAGLTELPGSDRRVLWILSRQFVRHNAFELPENLPSAKRKAALSLLVRKWAPFAATDYVTQWSGHRASVYAWDKARAEEQIRSANLNPTRCTVMPESFIRTPGLQGARLVKAVDGYEGQTWQNGFLASGRWWPRLPALAEWRAFLRASGIAPDAIETASPSADEPALLATPWTGGDAAITDIWSALQNKRIAAAVAVLAVAPALFFGAQIAVFSMAAASTSAAVAELEGTNKALRSDRMEAYSHLEAAEELLTLVPYPPQYEIMARVLGLLADRGPALSEWAYSNGTLELTLQSEQTLDATFYITLFEKEDMFAGVSAVTGDQEKQLRVRMSIEPRSAAAS